MKKTFNSTADAIRGVLDEQGLGYLRRPGGALRLEGMPKGAGKTARDIARQVFGSEKAVIHLNMNEYSDPRSICKLVGVPPGYVGYESGGGITNQIIRQPRSLILLDEVDKADPEFLKAVEGMLAAGSITDNRGVKVSTSGVFVLEATDKVSDETIARRQAAERRAALELAIGAATVLQSPLNVGKPLSFRNKFQMF